MNINDVSNRVFRSSISSGDNFSTNIAVPDNPEAAVREAASKLGCHMKQQRGYFESVLAPFLAIPEIFGSNLVDDSRIVIEEELVNTLDSVFESLPGEKITLYDKDGDPVNAKAITLVSLGKAFTLYYLEDWANFRSYDLIRVLHVKAFTGEAPNPADAVINDNCVFLYEYDNEIVLANYMYSDYDFEQFTLQAILTDLTESDAINEFLDQTCTVLSSYVGTIESKISMISQLGQSKFQSVKDCATALISGLSSGGLSGGLTAVTTLLQPAANIVNSDGTLTFADNRGLCPASFASGILTTIHDTLNNVGKAIGTIIKGVLGTAFAALKAALNLPSELIEWAESSEYAAINVSDKVKGYMTPYGMARGYFDRVNFDNTDAIKAIIDLFDSGVPIVCVTTIFGTFIIWPFTLDSNGVASRFAYEFHPGIENNTHNAKGLIAHAIDLNLITVGAWTKVTQQGDPTMEVGAYREVSCAYNAQVSDFDFDGLLTLIHDPLESIITNDATGDHTGRVYTDDLQLSLNIASNIVSLFIIMIACGIRNGNETTLSLGYENIQPNVEGVAPGDTVTGLRWNQAFVDLDNTAASMDVMINLMAPFMPNETISWSWRGQTASFFVNRSNDSFWDSMSAAYGTAPRPSNWETFPSVLKEYQVAGSQSYQFLSRSISTEKSIQMGSYWSLEADTEWAILVPSLTRGSVRKLVRTVMLVTTIASVAILIPTLKFKSFARRKRAANAARAESTWAAYCANPTKENYKAYRKTVRRNNWWQKIIGGTKYDATSYWGSGSTEPDGQLAEELYSKVVDTSATSELGDGAEQTQMILNSIIGTHTDDLNQ